MLNKWLGIGNLTADPEMKYLTDGKALTKFSIATNKKVNGKTITFYMDCETWGKTAETCAEYLTKGKKIYVEGELKEDRWGDNNEKHKTVCSVFIMKMLGKKDD